MDAEGHRSAPAVVQDDRGVTDGYDSGNQHKPTKRLCGFVSYGNGREQAGPVPAAAMHIAEQSDEAVDQNRRGR